MARKKMSGKHWNEYSAARRQTYGGTREEFDRLPKGDQTAIFFTDSGCSLTSQGAYHTSPPLALEKFRMSLKHSDRRRYHECDPAPNPDDWKQRSNAMLNQI